MDLQLALVLVAVLIAQPPVASRCFKKQVDAAGVDICSCDAPFQEIVYKNLSCEKVFVLCASACSAAPSCVSFNIFALTSTCSLSTHLNCMRYYNDGQCSNYILENITRTLFFTADNFMLEMYVDGVDYSRQVEAAQDWTQVSKVVFPYDARTIAIHAGNLPAGLGGLMVRTEDAYVFSNSETWKCRPEPEEGWFEKGFDDSSWPMATFAIDIKSNEKFWNVHNGSQWIWAARTDSTDVYCRSTMKAYTKIKV